MSETPTPPPGVPPDEFAAHLARESRRNDTRSARRSDGIEFSEIVAQLKTLPPETPAEIAAREQRLAESEHRGRVDRFRRICPPEFMQKVNPALLANPTAFEKVKTWDGRSPGPLLTGATGASKSRAAWAALYNLNVNHGRNFAWFPVKRLITEFLRYEGKDLADEFWRTYRGFNVLFVDDLDKFNLKYDSEGTALFAFYDWIYREHIPCITTTNKERDWWTDLMGDAFARRLFDDAHTEVKF